MTCAEDLKNIKGVMVYDKDGQIISGRDCVGQKDGGKICTTIFPDGKKSVVVYGPGATEN